MTNWSNGSCDICGKSYIDCRCNFKHEEPVPDWVVWISWVIMVIAFGILLFMEERIFVW